MVSEGCEGDRRRGLSVKPQMPGTRDRIKGMMIVLIALLLWTPYIVGVLGLAVQDGSRAEPEDGSAHLLATGSPPRFLAEPFPDPLTLNKGQTWTFTTVVIDADNDTLHVVWDWGDGTDSTNDTGPAATMQILRQSHAWTPDIPGVGTDLPFYIAFILNITLDDHQGNYVYCLTTIKVNMPKNGYPSLNITIPHARVDPADLVTIVANASDPEGEALTWIFTFNNGTEDYYTEVHYTPVAAPNQTVWNNITHTFGAVGAFKVTLNVTDAPIPYQVYPHNLSKSADVRVENNLGPQVLAVINVNPNEPVLRSETGFVLVNFSVEAQDPDGDILTATWDFGDGTDPIVNTSSGGTLKYVFTQVRNYTDGGIFNVSVKVTDGRAGHEVLLYKIVWVNSTNRPPSLVRFDFRPAAGNYAAPNETLNFTMIIRDPENDPIEVFIDWGDNSTVEHYILTEFVNFNATLILTHSYARVGNYTINFTYTDNKIGLFNHNKSGNASVRVHVPPPVIIERWSWWDYTSLGLFSMIPVLIALRFFLIARRRKEVALEGMSLEEWKLIKSEEKKGGPGPT